MTHRFFSKIKFLTLIILVAVAFNTGLVKAQDQFDNNIPDIQMTASPAKLKLEINPGKTTDGSFKIINSGKNNFDFKVYSKPYSVSNENYDADFNSESNFTQITRWIKFEKEKYSLSANKEVTVNFKVNTPSDIPNGGQYAVLMAETINKNTDNKNNISARQRLGIVLYSKNIGTTKNSGKISNISIPFLQIHSKLNGSFKIENDGNTDFDTTTKLSISDIFGNNKLSNKSTITTIPTFNRNIELKWNNPPKFGLFKLDLTNNYLNQTDNYSQYVLFISPIVALITIITIILLLTGFIYTRKNKKRS